MGLDQYLVKINGEDSEVVVQWRKENHLQNWFIHNTDYDENTQMPSSPFGIDKIKELLADLKKVNKDNASSVMPTLSGFFYGSTNYDSWYFDSIKEQIAQLEVLIANHEEGDTYQYETWY